IGDPQIAGIIKRQAVGKTELSGSNAWSANRLNPSVIRSGDGTDRRQSRYESRNEQGTPVNIKENKASIGGFHVRPREFTDVNKLHDLRPILNASFRLRMAVEIR